MHSPAEGNAVWQKRQKWQEATIQDLFGCQKAAFLSDGAAGVILRVRRSFS
ncbi:MAG TPA: hypothetical protein P5205_11040 [Candidatus Paceibacterota bacterium]|nr:hypothetical protein [Verrucomicrobiota bacterium]HSA10892.1 hypothetical protein [Candidatus Paceibacterota bacterium]